MHGFSKFLWLNNFFLGAMKKSFYDFFQKCLSLNKIIILTPSGQKNPIFSKGHREKFDFLCFLPSSITVGWYMSKLEIAFALDIYHSSYPVWIITNWLHELSNKICKSTADWHHKIISDYIVYSVFFCWLGMCSMLLKQSLIILYPCKKFYFAILLHLIHKV